MMRSNGIATAVDSNVLLDVMVPNAPHRYESRDRLNEAARTGSVIACDAVIAEIAGRFSELAELDRFLAATRLERSLCSLADLYVAGVAWRRYAQRRQAGLQCSRCGAANRPRCDACGEALAARQHIVADFLIGAHAMEHADRLLTRDRGFYAAYFPDLALV